MTRFHFNFVVLLLFSWPAVVDASSDSCGFRYDPWDEYGPEWWYLVATDTANQCHGNLQSPIAVPTGSWMQPCTRIVQDPVPTYTADCFTGIGLEYAITDHNLEARVNNNNNNKNNQQCSWTDGEGVTWTLQSLHVHLGWEHRSIENQDDDTKQLELHLVHSSTSGKTLVIGIRFEAQEQHTADPLLAHLLAQWWAVASADSDNVDDENNTNDISAYILLSPSAYFYQYRGSFTTPPCTQDNVTWLVVPEIRSLSLEQFQTLQDLVMDYRNDEGALATVASWQNRTARPLQAQNGRDLDLVCSRQHVRKQRRAVAGIVLVVAVGTCWIVVVLLLGWQRQRNKPDGLFLKEDYGVLA